MNGASGTAMATPDDVRFEREMGLSHLEFWRSLPGAVESRPHQIDGNRVVIDIGTGQLELLLGEEKRRRIASLSLPVSTISFHFSGVSESDRERFMRRFDISFQRGGG